VKRSPVGVPPQAGREAAPNQGSLERSTDPQLRRVKAAGAGSENAFPPGPTTSSTLPKLLGRAPPPHSSRRTRWTPSASIGAPQPKWTACSPATMPMPHAHCEVAVLFPGPCQPDRLPSALQPATPPTHRLPSSWDGVRPCDYPATFLTHQLTHQHISVSVVRGHSPCLSQPVTFWWSGLDRPAGHLASALLPDDVRPRQSTCISELPSSLPWPPP
jgi:hypothetical protein